MRFHPPKRLIYAALLIGLLLVPFATATDQGGVMHPNASELADDAADYSAATVFDAVSEPGSSDPVYVVNDFPKKSYREWNQGECGNCWVWTGTALLSQSYYNYSGIATPLSIQFFNSNYENGNINRNHPGDWACTGGNVEEFARAYNAGLDQTYAGLPFVVPWDNYNASYKDRSNDGNENTTTVLPKELMTITPNIGFNRINPERVLSKTPTNQTEAIRNMTAVLLDGKVMYYSHKWPDDKNYTVWKDLWENQPDGLYDPDSLNGSLYNTSSGEGSSHAMVLIGYNKTDADDSKWYWIVQNSWGDSTAGRANGQFRLKMKINYDARFTDNDPVMQFWVYNVTWKTDPTVTSITPSSRENTGFIDFNLAGTGFRSGAVVNLTRSGASDITASEVTVVSPAKITGIFDLTTAVAGKYNVVVTNTDNRSGTLVSGFTVVSEAPSPADSSDEDSSESASLTSPGGAAGQAMMFDLRNQLSETDPAEVVSVDVIPAETLGQTELMVVDGVRVDTAGLEGRTVNQVMSLTLVGVNPSKIDHADISFTVSRSWLEAHNLKPENIVLMRNTGGVWTELPTAINRQTANAFYFTARTPGFSYFAVTTRKNISGGTVTTEATIPATGAATVPATAVPSATLPSSPRGTISAPLATNPSTANNTMAAPAGGAGSGIPFLPAIAGTAAIIVVVIGGIFLQRWWIRRQNPALFRKYD
jgi:PGF-pre-PGF domain-containing protein